MADNNENLSNEAINRFTTITIEELAVRKGVPAWAMAAMKQAYKWGEGKMLTEVEFDKLHEKLLKGTMARRRD